MIEDYWDGENWLSVIKDKISIKYYLDEKVHRNDGPAVIFYFDNGFIGFEKYKLNGKMHRNDDGPAYIEYFESLNGKISKEIYYQNDEMHSINGPAEIWYYKNDKIKAEFYHQNGLCYRCDGPAIIYYYPSGFISRKDYYYNNSCHKWNGPAVIFYDKNGNISQEDYYFNGNRIKDEDINFCFPVDSKEKKFYINLKYEQ